MADLEKNQVREYHLFDKILSPQPRRCDMSKQRIRRAALLGCLLAGIAIATSACGQNQTPTEEYSIGDYYPFTQNVKMVYEGQGNEFASYTTYVDYITTDKIQIRTNNGGTEYVTVLQNSDGMLAEINRIPEMFYKTDYTGSNSTTSDVLLKEPLIEGTKWTGSDGSEREITGTDVAVETPYGDFEALEVTTTTNGLTVEKSYYALDIGLVKTVYTGEEDEVSSSLKDMVIGGVYEFNVRTFNFAVTDTDIQTTFEDKKVELNTGENINEFFQSEFLGGELISANTMLNDLWLNPGDDVANIDFTKQFVTEMNAGTTKESGVLRSVANTIGYYFQVQKVIITIDGEPYSSGHILMKEGEAFETTYQNEDAD